MEFNWTFGPATVESIDSLSNVIIRLDWVCLLLDQENVVWKNSGQVELPPVDPEHFIPFDLITEADVESWVFSVINKEETEQKMLTDYQESLKIKSIPLPF